MKHLALLILTLILSSCSEKKQDHSTTVLVAYTSKTIVNADTTEVDDNPYDYDTILKKGFHLSYRRYKDTLENIMMQSLTLVKDGHDIKELNSTSYPMLYKNLGYIGADFGDSFVFTKSFGSGNPHEIQLIDKKTGKEIKAGSWVGANDEEGILVYIDNIHNKDEQLKIYDVKNKKELIINDFKNSKCYKEYPEGLRSCIDIDTVTTDKVVLKIDTDDEKIIRTYKRSTFK